MRWNIVNLSSEIGVALRGHKRSAEQYEVLRKYIQNQNPDIIVLQEMGSKKAVEQILGDEYIIGMESHCYKNESDCLSDVDNIFQCNCF